MSYLRPIELDMTDRNITAEFVMSDPVFDHEKKKLLDVNIAPSLIFTIQEPGKSVPTLPIDPAMIDKDKFELFNHFTYRIGKMIRLAELNLDKLQDFISLYFSVNDYETVCNINKKCRELLKHNPKNNFKDLTFGELRNVFSCILKTEERFSEVSELETPEKRNNFSKLYADYIVDRDSYTHGKLFFLYPEFRAVLRIKPPGREEHYVEISEDIIMENISLYYIIGKKLDVLSQILKT